MFWETLWALVLGFALSGAVQAFVYRGQMQRGHGAARARGDHGHGEHGHGEHGGAGPVPPGEGDSLRTRLRQPAR